MKLYSLIMFLAATITAIAILQIETQEVRASGEIVDYQSNQIHSPATGSQVRMFPPGQSLAIGNVARLDSDGENNFSEGNSYRPDLTTVNNPENMSVKDASDSDGRASLQIQDDPDEGEELGHGNETGGDGAQGNHTWDAATNG